MLISANFGSARSGLATVGYKILNADKSQYAARTTTGVTELGGGVYAVTVPDADLTGRSVLWDSGQTPAVYAAEEFGAVPTAVAVRQEVDANSTQLAAILEDTGTTLDGLVKDIPTNAELATALAAADDAVLAAIAALNDYDGSDTTGTTTLLTRLSAAWAAQLDAAISTRSTYDGSDTAGTTTLLARLTAGWAALLDVAVSTRLATAGYTAPDNVGIADIPTNAELNTALAAADDAMLNAIAALVEAGFKKNTAVTGFPFFMASSSDHISGKTGLTITATRSLDGEDFADCANAAVEMSDGWYKIDLAAADLNADMVALRFSATGADATNYTIKTSS